jgi:hypothetical protein
MNPLISMIVAMPRDRWLEVQKALHASKDADVLDFGKKIGQAIALMDEAQKVADAAPSN